MLKPNFEKADGLGISWNKRNHSLEENKNNCYILQ